MLSSSSGPFPSQENAPENSNQNWSSLKGSDQVPRRTRRLALSVTHVQESRSISPTATRPRLCHAFLEDTNAIQAIVRDGKAAVGGVPLDVPSCGFQTLIVSTRLKVVILVTDIGVDQCVERRDCRISGTSGRSFGKCCFFPLDFPDRSNCWL